MPYKILTCWKWKQTSHSAISIDFWFATWNEIMITSAAQFSPRHLCLECNHVHHVTGQNGDDLLQWRHIRENADPHAQLKIINMQTVTSLWQFDRQFVDTNTPPTYKCCNTKDVHYKQIRHQ